MYRQKDYTRNRKYYQLNIDVNTTIIVLFNLITFHHAKELFLQGPDWPNNFF